MVKYSRAVQTLARQYRVPARVIQNMADTAVIDPAKLTNGSQEPDGLITLTDAASKYGIALDTLRRRVQRQKLMVREKRPAPGGECYLVAEADIVKSVEHPPKRGPQPLN